MNHGPGKGPPPSVRVDVLGPLRLTVDGEMVEVPGPKRRAVLALLAMAEGRTVPTDDLLDALWPTGVPDSARGSLHSHVSRLRGHLGSAAPRLERLGGGYRLVFDGDGSGTDVLQARSLHAAAKTSDPSHARQLLGQARSLWRGPALAEFIDVAPLTAWAVSLDELRGAVEQAYVAATLAAGAAGEAVELATVLVADDPLSESAVRLLMRALDGAGRSADALRAGHDYRRRLAEATGLEPSPALGELERAIAGRTTASAGAPPRRPAGRLRGRDSELAALHRLLAHERLVTVLGAGGVGKTRLAREVAFQHEQATALWLASVTHVDAIPHALAAALGLRVVHGDVLAACAALLAPGRQLLLIDNCEHLLAGVPDVVTMLLDTCPQLTVLATSREPLGLPVEQRLRLAPLPLASAHDPDDLARAPAVAVFIDRARRVQPDFPPGAEDLRLVAEVVRRLDGVPLAIELAAARLSSLQLADLRDRIDRALDLLGDGRTGTLRQTIEWSYALLPADEQRLLRHLAVFPDGFDLTVAEAVATELGVAADAAGALAHLVDASMVEAVLGGPSRYRMLDMIRSFALDQLETEHEGHSATERFRRWALELVAWIGHTSNTAHEPLADRVLRGEVANLRAAWRLARTQGRLDDAVRMVLGLTDAASWRDLTEVWDWGLELADDPATQAHPHAASVLGLAAASAWSRGELERADRLARSGLALGGDSWRCPAALALVALSRGDLTAAIGHGTQAAASASGPDQSLGVAALAAAYKGDLDQAIALNERLGAISRSPTIEAFLCYVDGEIHALAARAESAEEHYERAIALARQTGATFVEGIASVGLLTLRADTGRVSAALDGYRDLLEYWERTGGWAQQWTTLRNLARLLHAVGDDETALFLDAAVDHAPDAPATNAAHGRSRRNDLPAHRAADIRAKAAVTDRRRILEIARQAITAHHGTAPAALTHPR